MAYFFLTIAVVTEVVGSSLLKFTDGFKRLLPTLGLPGAPIWWLITAYRFQ